jgi:hypothetical protein
MQGKETAMNHQTRVYNDVFEMLPTEENPSPMVRIHHLNPSPEFTLYAKLEWVTRPTAAYDLVRGLRLLAVQGLRPPGRALHTPSLQPEAAEGRPPRKKTHRAVTTPPVTPRR